MPLLQPIEFALRLISTAPVKCKQPLQKLSCSKETSIYLILHWNCNGPFVNNSYTFPLPIRFAK
jgi:hypothetical protein